MPDKTFNNFRNSVGGNSGNDQPKSYRASSRSTVKTVDPDVSGAKKSYDDIFKHAKTTAAEFNKFYIKSSATAVKTVADITITTYNKMYVSMENMHKSYISSVLSREAKAAQEAAGYWANVRSGSGSGNNSGIIYGSNGSVISGNNPSSSSSSYGGSYDISGAMKSLGDSIGNKVGNATSRIDKMSTDKIADSVSAGAGKSASGIGKTVGSMVAKTIGDLLGSYLKIWYDRFKQGIDRIYNTYEQTYTHVSVLMNQDQEQYMKWQTSATDSITQMGLKNNVALSEVMKTLDNVVGMGITGQEAQNKALADTINKTLSPFVDTASDAYTDLQLTIGRDFIEPITGMGEALNQQVGSSRVFNKSINQVIEMLNPIMMNAQSQYAQDNLGDMMAQLEASGMSTADASEYAFKMANIAKNPYEALTGGDIESAVIAATSSDVTNINANMQAGRQFQTSIMSGADRSNAIGLDAIASVTGMGGSYAYWMNGKNPWEGTYNVDTDSQSAYDQLFENYSNDKYNTATAQRNISSENSMLGVAQFKQRYPDAYNILEEISGKLGEIISTMLVLKGGDIISNLVGGKGGSLLKSAGKVVGKGVKGLGKAATSVGGKFAASTIGQNLASAGGGSLGVGMAGVAAGGALAVYGGTQAVKSIQKANSGASSDKEKAQATGDAVGYGIGAAGGAVAVGALLAGSGPIGWAALAIGGLAVGITELVKATREETAVVGKLNEEHDKQIEVLKQEQEARKENIKNDKETFEALEETEDKKRFLVEKGIVTEEEAQKMTTSGAEQYFKEWEEQANKISEAREKEAKEIMEQNTKQAKEDADKYYEQNKGAIVSAVQSADESKQKEMLKSLGIGDDKIKDIMSKSGDDRNQAINSALTTKDGLFGWWGKSTIENMSAEDYKSFLEGYNVEGAIAPKYTESEYEAMNKEYSDAKSTVSNYSNKDNLSSSERSELEAAREILNTKYKDGMPSMYAAGIDYVPSERLAMIHQGEAVLNQYENRDYRRASAITSLFGSGGLAASGLFGLLTKKSSLDLDKSEGTYTEITDAISACAKLIVDAINKISGNQQPQAPSNSYDRLVETYNSKYNTTSVNQSATDQYSSLVRLEPSIVRGR